MDEQTSHSDTTHTPVAAVSPSNTATSNQLAIPIAIVLGFGLIAAAVFFSGGGMNKNAQNVDPSKVIADANGGVIEKGPVRPVDAKDHIRGNPNAPIVIVEYSDFECPFCKNFHETMNKIMDKYGSDGKVAWVYRQFPIEQLHPSAPRIAEASECVAELAGNDAFWKFSDQVFGERGVNEPTNMSRLTEFATTAGVDATAFNACLEDGRTKKLVTEDMTDGINAGAKGTPYSVVTVGGQEGVINGAQPYEYVDSVLTTLVGQLEGKKESQ
jgi:protein-disulfide isomerase